MEVFQAIACVSLDLGVGELRMPDVLCAVQLHAVTGMDHAANKVRKTQRQGRDNEERRPSREWCNTSRILGVQIGSGPSSKVRKIRFSVPSLNRPPPTRLDPVNSTNLSIQTSAD